MVVLTNDRSNDDVLGKYARNTFMYLSTNNIDMKIVHIAEKNNPVADLLSRWFTVPNNVHKSQELVHPVIWVHTNQDLSFTVNETEGVHRCYSLCALYTVIFQNFRMLQDTLLWLATSRLSEAFCDSTKKTYFALFRTFLAYTMVYGEFYHGLRL